MAQFVMTCDDFGRDEYTNSAVFSLSKKQPNVCASLMLNAPKTLAAVKLAKENSIMVGLHLNFDSILKRGQFGLDERDIIKIPPYFFNKSIMERVREETVAQIKQVLAYGIQPAYIDSHHHSHLFLSLLPYVLDMARDYNIMNVRFYSRFYSNDTDAALALEIIDAMRFKHPAALIPLPELSAAMNKFDDKGTYEIMVHPQVLGPNSENWRTADYERALSIVNDNEYEIISRTKK